MLDPELRRDNLKFTHCLQITAAGNVAEKHTTGRSRMRGSGTRSWYSGKNGGWGEPGRRQRAGPTQGTHRGPRVGMEQRQAPGSEPSRSRRRRSRPLGLARSPEGQGPSEAAGLAQRPSPARDGRPVSAQTKPKPSLRSPGRKGAFLPATGHLLDLFGVRALLRSEAPLHNDLRVSAKYSNLTAGGMRMRGARRCAP